MYASLWRRLPGRTALKIIQLLLLMAGLLVVLDRWVFPWVANGLWLNSVTVGE